MPKADQGFTLIELLVALTIAGILVLVGVPSLGSLMGEFRAQTASSQWQNDLAFARQAAAAYQTNVTICPLEAAAGCDGDWAAGYTVFIDVNSDGNLGTGDEVLQRRGAINSNDHVNSDAPTQFRFGEDGFTDDAGTLVYCPIDPESDSSRAVSVRSTGQTRQTTTGVDCA